eukprot:GHVU01091308.1.p1 GENE.GHVU01091308.1~~GHVU01091308.1.p1  ORF type:complete len:277 (-),score=9.40 GHVU01091308.1:2722-3552(-)
MKTLFVAITVLFVAIFSLFVVWWDVVLPAYAEHSSYVGEVEEEVAPAPPEAFRCPVSQLSDNSTCMSCHKMILEDGKPKFGLKEILIEAAYEEKPFNLNIVSSDGKLAGYYLLSDIRPQILDQIKRYMFEHPELKKLIIEIHSPGGSVMDAWRIVGIIKEMQSRGIVVETRCYGMAASAGSILLIAGDIGHRFVNPHAEIMIHKVWTFSMFSVADPDSSEDKTDMLKHFQKNINEFFASRTKITISELDSKTFHKMWWLQGSEAVELGVADGLIGE